MRYPLLRRPIPTLMRNFAYSLVALLIGAVPSAAHAIVVQTSLKVHPVAPGTPATVVLRFSQKVQLALTKLVLVNEQGDEHALKFAPGKRQGEVNVSLPALPAGRYVLRYNVLAIDGHFTEGVVRFRVLPRK